MQLKKLVDYINWNDGDIIAIKTDDSSICGVAGSTENFKKGFLNKGEYILLRAIDTKKIK